MKSHQILIPGGFSLAALATVSVFALTTPAHTQPELYGGLPKDPTIPWTVKLWKGPLKWLGNAAMIGGLIGLVVHYLRFGPKTRDDEPEVPHEGAQP